MSCPGCGASTPDLTIHHGSGASHWSEDLPSWCEGCIGAKIAAARAPRPCHCSDPAHDHSIGAAA